MKENLYLQNTYFSLQAINTSILAVRNHVKNNINKKNVIVEPYRNKNYKPVPLYSLVEPQDQQDQEYEQIEPGEQGAM